MLAVNDVEESASYFRDQLGFTVMFVAKSDDLPGYAVVTRDGFEAHFLEDLSRNPEETRSGINATVDDIDSLFKTFQEQGAFHESFPRHLDAIREHPPEDKEYGMRDLIFVNPDGYILVFGQPL